MSEEKRSYYAIIPANVRYDKDLIPSAKLLYGEITALCNEKGYCWATNQYFADLYDAGYRTITSWLHSLKSKGYIKVKNVYKSGTKEIVQRQIFLGTISDADMAEICQTYGRKEPDPLAENSRTPLAENSRENITVINNTVNITNKETPSAEALALPKDSLSTKSEKEKAVENMVYDAMLAVSGGVFSNYPKERKNSRLAAKAFVAKNPDNPLIFAETVIKKYGELVDGNNNFWRGQPLTPSGFYCMLDRIYAEIRSSEQDLSYIDEMMGDM